MSLNEDCSEKTIVEDLLSMNVCYRCCLRVLTVESLEKYRNAEKCISTILKIDETEEPVPKTRKPNPCTVCLGLLNDNIVEEVSHRVINHVSAEEYDSDHMTCALSLPISFQLRNHALWLYITHKYYNYYLDKYACTEKIKKELAFVSVKEVWKLLTAASFSKSLKKILTNETNRYFFVNIHIDYADEEKDTDVLRNFVYKSRNSSLTRKGVDLLLNEITYEDLIKYNAIPPQIPSSFVTFHSIQCQRDSLYIAGRYNKFSRSLCQTPWIVNGVKKMETSLQDIITAPVNKLIKNDGIVFIGSGREDVDVRMLGTGRPFCLEVTNPRFTKLTSQHFLALEKEMNLCKDIFIRDLQLVRKDELHHIKSGEESKTKTYECYCVVQLTDATLETINLVTRKIEELVNIKDLVLEQKTPIRVLHRRSLCTRCKTVFWLKPTVHKIQDRSLFFKLSAHVQAGTYVKEFIHGDFGRTLPNLNILLNEEVDILALDVQEVHLDWPPTIQY